jgi:hypothetical protein
VRTTTRPHRLTVLLLGAAGIPLVLGACGSSTTSSGATTTTRAAGHQGAGSVCSLVSPARIRSVLGLGVGDPTVRNSTTATLCTYASDDRAVPVDTVLIGYRGHVTPTVAATEQATLAKLHDTTTDVSGSGVQAYYYSVDSGAHTVTTLVSLVGGTQVTVTSTATVAQAEALSTLIFQAFATDATSTTTTTTG